MRKVFILVLTTIFSVSISAQSIRTDFDLSGYGVAIVADKRLITVRTTLELAGVKTDLSVAGDKFRAEVLNDFKDFNPELRSKLKVFVDQYRKRHPELTPAETISPFIAMAYSLSPAPNLAEPERTIDLPDNLLEVLDYSPLVREFYRSPGVSERIESYEAKYLDEVEFLKPSAREMVRDLLDYLHTRPQLAYLDRIKVEYEVGKKKLYKYENVERQRTFTIVPDLLAAKSNINFLNIKDTYFAIIPPRTDVSSSEVRRAYLQFVLDPMVLNESREIFLKEAAIKTLLIERRKERPTLSPDPFLAVSRSLVSAADIREQQFRRARIARDQARRKIDLMKTDEDRKAVSAELTKIEGELADEALLRLVESYENGAVFAFYFADKLVGIEQSGFDVSGSIKDWILTLDPKTETNRLEENRVASQKALIARERRKTEKVTTLVENPLTQELIKIDGVVNAKGFDEAETRLNKLLDEYSENTIETARVYYSLGRMTSLKAENTSGSGRSFGRPRKGVRLLQTCAANGVSKRPGIDFLDIFCTWQDLRAF